MFYFCILAILHVGLNIIIFLWSLLINIFIASKRKMIYFFYVHFLMFFFCFCFTLCLAESLTGVVLCDQDTAGFGSAWIRHSNNNRFPSSSCLMAGFFANVGAIPSICLLIKILLIYGIFFNKKLENIMYC